MSKTITSPVKEFPGTVKLFDRLTFPQALAYEKSLALSSELIPDEVKGLSAKEIEALKEMPRVPSQTEFDAVMLEAICQCVEEWNLDGFEQLAPDTFPATPRQASAELVAWVYGEIAKLYSPDVPNE